MMSEERLKKIQDDLMSPVVKKNKKTMIWILFLLLILGGFGFFYYQQLQQGLVVTGMRDYVYWGIYISTFVFFVAISLVGALVSSIFALIGFKWIAPISRIAEIIAIAFVTLAGIIIILDMGRPERLLNIFVHGRIQSPILWDFTVIITYMFMSLLLLYIPLIPDLAVMKERLTDVPKWKRFFYKKFSLGFKGTKEQFKLINKAMKVLALSIVPVALGIHTITAWLFASTLNKGWDSAFLGPYFVAGAFPAGVSAVVILMYIVRKNYKLQNYITKKHFDLMGKVLVLLSLIYLYFSINEYIVPAFKIEKGDINHLTDLFLGDYASIFWSTQIFGLILPIILLIFKPMRRPVPLFLISIFVIIGAWLKRYLIVIPTMEHPFLPIQHVPNNFKFYMPTMPEIAITVGAVAMALLLITIFVKLVPIMSMWEVAKQEGIKIEEQFKNKNSDV